MCTLWRRKRNYQYSACTRKEQQDIVKTDTSFFFYKIEQNGNLDPNSTINKTNTV